MPQISLTPFVGRWKSYAGSERSGAQSHFIDLRKMLGQPTPSTDPLDPDYAFETGVAKAGGGKGFADVWKRGCFAWEYKAKGRNLKEAYNQLLQYKDSLDNPRLLVVCDFERFRLHTNFNGIPTKSYEFTLSDLSDNAPLPGVGLSPLGVLRALFEDPHRLKPGRTSAQVTEEAAAQFAMLAESLRRYGAAADEAAHFLMRLLFCLFAQGIGLLPKGLFTELVDHTRAKPVEFSWRVSALFEAMATGGFFGTADILYFDGGLFADGSALVPASDDMEVLARVSRLDWAGVEPAIFGTLFERSLDPSKRSQLGAHYTSRDDILLIVEPVLMAPLRQEWAELQASALDLAARQDEAKGQARTRHEQALQQLLIGFSSRLAGVRVLDPACGSGNFLYVALKLLLDLEKEVITFAATQTGQHFFPQVGPDQLHGIEINPYAHELAQVVVWIGYIQWLHDNGFGYPSAPILKPLDSVLRMDAILARDVQGRPAQPEWPEADVIVGNPPFLGGNRIRHGLGDGYVETLFALYDGLLPKFADLVCYWFERARELIAAGKVKRAGLLATQGIRGGANRRVLERIKETSSWPGAIGTGSIQDGV
ncbi:MAG: DNA methyltransferase, partial [Chloroflexota bacterium]